MPDRKKIRSSASRPNFLILMVDEERYPPVYESREVKTWRRYSLLTQEFLRQNGMEFHRHYAGSTACTPSRATLFTGQYPSLHGVSQTTGAAKGPFEPDMFWLDPNSVPTMGDYFRAAGYQTYYKGKWHISEADILLPGTHNAWPSYDPTNGLPIPEREQLYSNAGRLEEFGFTGWIGPEPHGSDPRNSGSSARIGLSGRDVVYAAQTANLIQALDRQAAMNPTETEPWVIVSSFVNPHDIALYGALSQRHPLFNFEVDATIPPVPPPPTFFESFLTKPRCQLSYRRTYGQAIQPLVETPFFRRLYYQLQKNVDQDMLKVFETLRKSSFYEDTIVIFTSDHGELLGAHGGLTQKWYCAYEEAIHVPLIFHNPRLFPSPQSIDMLTSHVDILPTMLGLAGVNVAEIQDFLRSDHTEIHPFVGRDLTPLITGRGQPERANEPIYFMTDDDMTKGLGQQNFLGWDYNSVIQPNHVETIIAPIQSSQGVELWKYSRYYDNPQFWSNPGVEDQVLHEFGPREKIWGGMKGSLCTTITKDVPVPDEIEMYNLTIDPLETMNLAHPFYATPATRTMQQFLAELLEQQCLQKRLIPSSGTIPGMPACIHKDTHLISKQI